MFPPAALPHHLNMDDREPLMYAVLPLSGKMLEVFSHKLETIVCYELLWKVMCRKYLVKLMNIVACAVVVDIA